MSSSPTSKKPTGFSVSYTETGESFRWTFARDPAGWFLVTHDGVERFVGENWFEAVLRIQLIVSNYGCESNIS
jgi:hypothetical protein